MIESEPARFSKARTTHHNPLKIRWVITRL